MVAPLDPKRAQAALNKISSRDANWSKAQALIFVEQAFSSLDAGDLQAASKLINKARKTSPDALELRLAQAAYYSKAPFPGLGRSDLKELTKTGKVSYEGAPLQYARALAELAWIDTRWSQDSARRDPLRLSSFLDRFTTLSKSLRARYPFKVRRIPGQDPRLIVSNSGKSALTVDVVGPGVDELIELDPEAEYTFVFNKAGVARVTAPSGEFSLLVEAYAGIDYSP